jgi:hypothetical protein
MLANGHADEEVVGGHEREADAFALEVRAGVVATEPPPAEWMFDWVYASPADAYERQRAEALGG